MGRGGRHCDRRMIGTEDILLCDLPALVANNVLISTPEGESSSLKLHLPASVLLNLEPSVPTKYKYRYKHLSPVPPCRHPATPLVGSLVRQCSKVEE